MRALCVREEGRKCWKENGENSEALNSSHVTKGGAGGEEIMGPALQTGVGKGIQALTPAEGVTGLSLHSSHHIKTRLSKRSGEQPERSTRTEM